MTTVTNIHNSVPELSEFEQKAKELTSYANNHGRILDALDARIMAEALLNAIQFLAKELEEFQGTLDRGFYTSKTSIDKNAEKWRHMKMLQHSYNRLVDAKEATK